MQDLRYSRYAWLTLAANLLVILWGAYVRATGSGAGCGSHWPLCNGEVVPRSPSIETLIELTHRLTSGVALLLVLGLVIGAWRRFPPGSAVRAAAVASLVLILVEAAIGAGLVLFELVAENESIARALFMAVHLANTFLLLTALALTAQWARHPPTQPWRARNWRQGLLVICFITLFLAGMSGAIAALGDTLYPAESLRHGLEQDLSPTASVLVRLRILHPFLAIVAGLSIFVLARRQLEQPARIQSRQVPPLARLLMLAVFLQLGCGLLNVALLAPVWMQQIHLLMADLLWILLVLTADLLTQEQPEKLSTAAVAA